MDYKKHVKELIKKIRVIANSENKMTGFCIGNTAKRDKDGLYFTPIRNTVRMIVSGVIVYGEKQAVEIAKKVDGQVDYVLVDAEKKIPNPVSTSHELANVERAVREVIRKSRLWVYKGNDLSAEAIDLLLMYLTKDTLRGIGGKKIAILGAGNLGCKLALMLVERGGEVFVTRRDAKKLKVIVQALNYMKPPYTTAHVLAANNEEAAENADILIGATSGTMVITPKMVKQLAPDAIIIEAGKGSFYPAALEAANDRNIDVYRLDVSAALQGLIIKLFAVEDIMKYNVGRRLFYNIPLVSGGLMGCKGDVVVDNVNDPKLVYGVANGNGDFFRSSKDGYARRLATVQGLIEKRP